MNYEPVVLEKKLNALKIREMTAIENKLNAGTKELMALSLFSGGGGLDLGFSAAGFRVGCSTDIDSFSCQTLILNNGRKIFYNDAHSITADITEISAEYLLRKAELYDSEIDIILGGPPCQAFSIFGRRKGLDDPRGNLVWEYLKIIQEIKPKAFVFENVPGLKSIHDGKLFEEILSELTIGGTYAISTHSYQMAEYGIPQFRERVFVIGAKNGSIVPRMLPTHGSKSLLALKNYRTVREALRYLPEPGTFSTVLNHIGRKHSPRIVSRYENLKFGERDPKTRINKLHPERPSFTIIVGSDKGGGKGHIHPFVPREVTPRESARMQTFPDWWEFYGTGRHVIRQVGNAVPPLFATLLAEHLRVHIFEKKKTKEL
ncbi:DNA cytosine methyltransferase [Nostoc sp.]|uniref:DNA cytosine methyltransferase n=1 Tax=Nostoc sp. TaxID=1180 RepID=UPI002FF5626E